MRVAVDVMGSDNFPVPDVDGTLQAARAYGCHVILVGDEAVIQTELAKYDTNGLSLEIVHTPIYILQTDSPSQVVRGKAGSSMHLASQMVADGRADAFVTAGNTGAALAICTLQTIKRLKAVERPCLAARLPVPGHECLLTDIGANVDCRPEWLYQFALMGSIYAERALSIKQPRIGLLSNGEESQKGDNLIHQAAELLKASSMYYIGNVEPKEVLRGGVDVTVSDGLLGNVFMKTMEAVGTAMFDLVRAEVNASWRYKLGGLLARPAFRSVYKQIDPFEIGGTLLMGINGVVTIAHGRTNALGMKSSIRLAQTAVQQEVVAAIRDQLG